MFGMASFYFVLAQNYIVFLDVSKYFVFVTIVCADTPLSHFHSLFTQYPDLLKSLDVIIVAILISSIFILYPLEINRIIAPGHS